MGGAWTIFRGGHTRQKLLRKRLDQLRPHADQPAERGSHAVFATCAGVVASFEADFTAQLAGLTDLKQTPRSGTRSYDA